MIEDVRRTFDQASAPVCGIIQRAMVLRDKLYSSMSTDEFHAALHPKVQGTWNLHNVALEKEIELGFFAMLSSICGIASARGQANHSAENAFLDAFDSYRRSLGHLANSVSLGVIGDVGYVNEHDEIQRRLLAQGWTPIREALLHKILHYSILQQVSRPVKAGSMSQLITDVPVPLPKESPVYRDIHFIHLRPAAYFATFGLTEQADSSLTLIRAAGKENGSSIDHERLLDAATELGNEKFVKSLGMSEPIDPARPLSSYGIDSLAAVEFRNWARAELSVDMTTLEVVAANTLTSLSEMILARLLKRS
ncbi:hypothetical protein G7Y89_g5496 [Cudoniella acicularis]|uniref:Carrier domain-containing protein n=1 Tax=Cudoniella acicularis TaxID=354080 RepID=A0A8H4RMC7_9HELO|nr:hypothetical protein G7Y89_g5496 [Cudoniella acicularis]